MTTRDAKAFFRLDGAALLALGALAFLGVNDSFAAGPQNIVLLYADDMDWTDLPFFAGPIHWENPSNPPTTSSDAQVREARTRAPDLNRSAARLLAKKPVGSVSDLGQDPIGPTPGALVVPVDRSGIAATGFYQEASYTGANNCAMPGGTCTATRDILPDHGGLRRLAQDGVVMPRMYAASARCAPSRAALLTGRSQVRVGVPNNHAWLNAREVTIAEFLKQGCKNGDSHACYRTALIGKWHLGEQGANSKQSPWKKGFDEFFGFGGGSRHYTSSNPLNCSPVTKPIPAAGFSTMLEAIQPPASRFCQIDPLAAGAPTCAAAGECPGYPGLVCGPSLGYCFDPSLQGDDCTHDSASCAPLFGRARSCQEHWLYLGPEKWDACPNGEAGVNPSCCSRNDDPPTIAGQLSNDDGKQPGTYSFKYKKARSGSSLLNVRFVPDADSTKPDVCNVNHSVFLDDGQPKFIANLDDTVGGNEMGSCLYSERFWRDAAVNFIKREKQRIAAAAASGAKTRRFFLMVAFHAAHDAHVSPNRSRKHYDTVAGLVPAQPSADYWGIIEELDSAIGTILRALDEQGLTSSTLVVFSNDNGAPSGSYGIPRLRGGKESVWEGGTRAGMLAFGPDVGLCDDGTCNGDAPPSRSDSTQGRARVVPHLGSQVDLFPTIADAAGLEDRFFTAPLSEGGGLQFNACFYANDKALAHPCSSNSDCLHSDPAKNGVCSNVRGIDGRSLLQALKDTDDNDPATPSYPPSIPDPQLVAPVRDQMFARFPASGYPEVAVMSRGGLFSGATEARGVCGYERNAKTPSGGSSTQLSGRVIQGSTCTRCDPGAADSTVDSTTCGGSLGCEILGGVCFPSGDSSIGPCSAGTGSPAPDFDCKLETRGRCSGQDDCPANQVCVQNIRVACESAYDMIPDAKCFAAGWKALGGAVNQNTDVSIADLFDMRTNTEEDARCRGDCGATYDGELDCRLNANQQAAFTAVHDNLKENLRCWNKCVTTNVTNYGNVMPADRWTCDRRLVGAQVCPF